MWFTFRVPPSDADQPAGPVGASRGARSGAQATSSGSGAGFDDPLLAVLNEATDAVIDALAGCDDWGPSGRPGQYASDLVADEAGTKVLHARGLRVLSEESGLDPGEGPVAVIDPIDGSTNAWRRLPWYATSICAVEGSVALAAVVHDHASGARFEAVRDRGSRRNGAALPVRRGGSARLAEAVIGVNGRPPRPGGWAQFRCMGAAALDLCAVAEGRLDGYIDFSGRGLGPWDYLGAMLVCREAGVGVRDGLGRDLVTEDYEARRCPVAAPAPLLDELLSLLNRP